MDQQRRTIHFEGRVQGVGFRQTTVTLSQDLPLAGVVRNLPDGRVELIAEGPPAAIDNLVHRLNEQFPDFIRNVHQTTSAATGLPRGIVIRY